MTTIASSGDGADRIQYGCGQNVLPGWMNVDGFKPYYAWHLVSEAVKREILRVELVERHPFPDACFRFGFAEDFLEHLDQAESIIFLSECFRCLRPEGVLRLSFPGLPGVLRRHYRRADYEGASTGMTEAFTTWSHKHFYCVESLDLVAKHIGFRRLEVVAFRRSSFPELCGLETREDQCDLNLIVELQK